MSWPENGGLPGEGAGQSTRGRVLPISHCPLGENSASAARGYLVNPRSFFPRNLARICRAGAERPTPATDEHEPENPAPRSRQGGNGDLGWIRLKWTSTDGVPDPETLTAVDWAYNDVSGQPILAGQTVAAPEPSSAALLALAGAGAAAPLIAVGSGNAERGSPADRSRIRPLALPDWRLEDAELKTAS